MELLFDCFCRMCIVDGWGGKKKIVLQRPSAISQNWALLLAAVHVINASSGRINDYASETIHQDKLTLTRALCLIFMMKNNLFK